MKILKIILIIIAIPLTIALFTKKEYTVEREIVINKPKQDVFNYIKLVKNQTNYNKWWQMDPNIKTSYKGTDGTPGFVASWESENNHVGKGEQEIKNISDGQQVDYELRFEKPFEGIATTDMETAAVTDNRTRVKWSFSSKMKYPMNLMLLVMDMDKMLGKDLETSLSTLKDSLEK